MGEQQEWRRAMDEWQAAMQRWERSIERFAEVVRQLQADMTEAPASVLEQMQKPGWASTLVFPDTLAPCACGCGKLVEGGLMETAHPEDYRGERG